MKKVLGGIVAGLLVGAIGFAIVPASAGPAEEIKKLKARVSDLEDQMTKVNNTLTALKKKTKYINLSGQYQNWVAADWVYTSNAPEGGCTVNDDTIWRIDPSDENYVLLGCWDGPYPAADGPATFRSQATSSKASSR